MMILIKLFFVIMISIKSISSSINDTLIVKNIESMPCKPQQELTLEQIIQETPDDQLIAKIDEILKLAATSNTAKLSLGFQLKSIKYLKLLAQESHYVSDFYPQIPLRAELVEALQNDLKFRFDFGGEDEKLLRSKFITNWHDCLIILNSSSKDQLITLFKTFQLDLGNFDIDPSTDFQVRSNLRIVTSKWTPFVSAFTQEPTDKILVMFAMAAHNSSSFKGLGLGIFQVWRESNFDNFEQFAPREVVEILSNSTD